MEIKLQRQILAAYVGECLVVEFIQWNTMTCIVIEVSTARGMFFFNFKLLANESLM